MPLLGMVEAENNIVTTYNVVGVKVGPHSAVLVALLLQKRLRCFSGLVGPAAQ
jgi:hypothetical protein